MGINVVLFSMSLKKGEYFTDWLTDWNDWLKMNWIIIKFFRFANSVYISLYFPSFSEEERKKKEARRRD